nr:pheromone-degrading enzyme [Popillia japonica]
MTFHARFLTILVFATGIFANNPFPTLEISTGVLQGTYKTSYNGRKFSAFDGVPYARPPVGELRFEAPKEPYNWTGTWIADTNPLCIQSFVGVKELGVSGEEDCLYLNIYVPREELSHKDNLDVILHIHGGAFMLGSGHFYAGPEYLMDEEVILVTINYRLGPFGFLSTEDEIQPGNNGLKDQVQALKWLRKNIKYFGGNPDSVTLTGMSAGGASVHYHYFSPLSKGLFHRGYSQSGTALNPWAFQEASLDKAKRLAVSVGCPIDTSLNLIHCLKSRSAYSITEAVKHFFGYGVLPFSPFGPVIEKKHDGAFITEHPYKMLVNHQVADIPWITSVTEREGIFPGAYFTDEPSVLEADFYTIAPHALDYNYTISEAYKLSITDKIKKQYFKESINVHDFITLLGDRHFKADAGISAKLQAKANKSPVYFYLISYRGERSFSELFTERTDDLGTSHADDILYYLHYYALTSGKLSNADENMKSIFLEFLVNFMRNGKPKISNIEWTPVNNTNTLHYLHINSPEDMYMATDEDLGAQRFWSKLSLRENSNYDEVKDEL